MKELFKWQTISFVSRFFATGVGLVQSIIVARILTTGEYGLVGIVTAVSAIVGAVRHLGLVSATTRELANTTDEDLAARIFAVSFLVRLVVAVPLSIALYLYAPRLALETYHQPATLIPFRLFSVILLIQSTQEIFNAVLAGRQKFAALFTFQAVTALVSLALFVPLVKSFGYMGYFWAFLAHNCFSLVVLGFLGLRALGWRLILPEKEEFKRLAITLLGLGLAIYVGKVIYIFWDKLGMLYLGVRVTPEEVGIFSFAILYAEKLLIVSDAVTDVNLPAMTSSWRDGLEAFRKKFLANFEKVYALMLLAGVTAIFWVQEAFHIFVGTKFDASVALIPPLMLAIFIYGLLNLLNSSVLVPVRLRRELIVYHVLMLVATGLILLLGHAASPLRVVPWAMVSGGLAALAYLSIVLRSKGIGLWSRRTLWPTLAVGVAVLVYFLDLSLAWRSVAFVGFLAFFTWFLPYLGILEWRRFFQR